MGGVASSVARGVVVCSALGWGVVACALTLPLAWANPSTDGGACGDDRALLSLATALPCLAAATAFERACVACTLGDGQGDEARRFFHQSAQRAGRCVLLTLGRAGTTRARIVVVLSSAGGCGCDTGRAGTHTQPSSSRDCSRTNHPCPRRWGRGGVFVPPERGRESSRCISAWSVPQGRNVACCYLSLFLSMLYVTFAAPSRRSPCRRRCRRASHTLRDPFA